MSKSALQEKLLLAMLPHVPFDGWGPTALRQGAADCGLLETEVHVFFPGGARDIVMFFSTWADQKMIKALEKHPLKEIRTRDRVALGVRLRLESLDHYRESVRRTIAYLALPHHTFLALRLLYHTTDALWRAVGDQSTDFNFYTKRALLAGVITATTLYWLDDKSQGHVDTWNFLARRIDEVLKIGQAAASVMSGGKKGKN